MNKILFLSFFAVIFSASAAVFNVGTKLNPASIEVLPVGNERLLITCTFKAQTKFSSDRNAFFNRAKADQLCRQGFLLYHKVGKGEVVDVSGIAIEKQPVRNGKMVKYFFSAPAKMRVSARTAVSSPGTAGAKAAEVTPAAAFESTSVSPRKSEAIIVFCYETENDSIKVVNTQRYTPKTFKSHKEFDDFCEKQFRQIDELAEINRQRVLKSFEKSKKLILKKTEQEF